MCPVKGFSVRGNQSPERFKSLAANELVMVEPWALFLAIILNRNQALSKHRNEVRLGKSQGSSWRRCLGKPDMNFSMKCGLMRPRWVF